MTSPLINNSAAIMREYLRKANLPKNKYNPSLAQQVEAMTGETGDERDGSDTGVEREYQHNK